MAGGQLARECRGECWTGGARRRQRLGAPIVPVLKALVTDDPFLNLSGTSVRGLSDRCMRLRELDSLGLKGRVDEYEALHGGLDQLFWPRRWS
jgi:hypothetical protein